MKNASTRCGFFSKSNAYALIAASVGWASAGHLHAETIEGGSEVQGNFTVGTTSTKGKLTVKAPNSVATDQATLGFEVSSAGGVYFGISATYPTQSYFPSLSSNGFYYSAAVASIQLGESIGYPIGRNSIAIGTYAEAPGDYSISAGAYTYAEGEASAAFNGSSASGYYSFSANWGQAPADLSFAAGSTVTATSYSSAVFGAFNKPPTANATAWVSTDPLFTIGNGTAYNQLSNALIIQKNGVANLYAFGAASTNPAIVLNPTGTTPSITVGGQKVVTSNSEGYIGIGVTPTNPLSVAADSATNEIIFTGSGSDAAEIVRTGNAPLVFGTNNQYRMTISGSGNVGIGTSSPATLLHLSTSGNAEIRAQTSGGSGTTAGINLVGGVANSNWWMLTNRADLATAGDSLAFFKASGTVGTKMVITDGGSVGIGTTSPNPSYRLDVNGYSSLGGLRINGNDEANTFLNLNGKQISLNSSAGNGITVKTNGAVVVGEWNVAAQQKFNVMGKSYLSDDVGIGTSSPTAKLEVVGTVKFAKQGDIPMGEFGLNGD